MSVHTNPNAPPFEVSFLKAMQLLHMPGNEATEQIKMMLDECLINKKSASSAFILPVKPAPAIAKPQVVAPKASVAPKQMMPLSPPSDDRVSSGCMVCKASSQESVNALVECQECRSLYHQNCHEPKIKEDIKDPRFVWYCSTCTSKRKRAKFTNSSKPTVILLPTGPNIRAKEKDGVSGPSSHQPEISPFKSWQFGRR